MLTNVPEAMNRMSRNVVINHPNSFQAVVARKTVNRTGGSVVGGLPTLGGLGVISSDDEENVTWAIVGDAYAKQVGGFEPAQLMDRQDANNGSVDEFIFMIEPEILEGSPGGFSIKKNDVIYLILSPSIRLAYEVIRPEATSNISPYTNRYVCNRRDDLHLAI